MTKLEMAKAVFRDEKYAEHFAESYPDAVEKVYEAYKKIGEID